MPNTKSPHEYKQQKPLSHINNDSTTTMGREKIVHTFYLMAQINVTRETTQEISSAEKEKWGVVLGLFQIILAR